MEKSNLGKFSLHEKIIFHGVKMKLMILFILVSAFQIQAKTFSGNPEVATAFESGSSINESNVQEKEIKGTIKDNIGVTLPGATIVEKGTANGVQTDFNGEYTITVSDPNAILVVSFLGYLTQEIHLKGRSIISVSMVEDASTLEEVVVVAYGTQKKESIISSVTSVKPSELKVPSSNLTTAMAGRLAGVISYQSSGEPGADNANFFVRGVTTFGYSKSPLILIDGVEMTSDDLARMQIDDIDSFSILKDAAATSVYGARGANGVILVTTKEGVEGEVKFNVRFENSWSQPTDPLEFADPITYMKLHNEAIKTRDPGGRLFYSQEKIVRSSDPNRNQYIYPTNDWQEMLFKDRAMNQRLNISASGGGKVARYYFAGSFMQDNGVLKNNSKSDFDSNINIKKYLLRSNINVNITPTTKATIRFYATFDDYSGPLAGGSGTYAQVMKSNPVLFPAYYAADAANEFTEHTLFGNSGDTGDFTNPYANMVRGYKESSRALMLAQFEVNQDLDVITEGLNLNVLGNINRTSFFGANRAYNPFYYDVASYNIKNDEYELFQLNPNSGTETLNYTPVANESITSVSYFESRLVYNRTFDDKHDIGGLLVSVAREKKISNVDDLESSLPSRNLGVSGRFSYGYDSRFFGEFSFGYNGSEHFAESERFGFFPSYGMGWTISNEKFFEPLSDKITNLKLRGSFGTIGNDAIGAVNERFFYLSKVNLNDREYGYEFGTDFSYYRNGNSIDRYGNEMITWETSDKLNIGLELDLFHTIKFQVDFYTEYRTNILMERSDIPSTMGLQAVVKGNIGETSSRGVDLSLDVNHTFDNGFWVSTRANFTYATSEFKEYEEPDYVGLGAPWRSRIDTKLGQTFGYVAERLFIDDADVANSPMQFIEGQYGMGDIKYKDIDGNGRIDELDQVALGHPTTPEIVYGFGSSLGYKGIDFSFFFQGLANRSFWINPRQSSPFLDPDQGTNSDNGLRDYNALLKVYADNVWLEEDRDPYSMFPRLSEDPIVNNEVKSSWWMRDGSFLRLKSVELGYSLPEKFTDKLKISSSRIYVSGTNLLTFSKFDLWDPEMAGNGLNYPIQSVFNIGVQASF